MPAPKRILSAEAADELETQALRIAPLVSARVLWEDVLTPKERKKLGGDFLSCYERLGTVGIWRRLRGGLAERAILEIALALEHIGNRRFKAMMREIGETPKVAKTNSKPDWNGNGELSFNGALVRRIRVMERPTNIQRILDSFQAADWTQCIANPLSSAIAPQQEQLHQALRSLNTGLRDLRFRSLEGGRSILWEPI